MLNFHDDFLPVKPIQNHEKELFTLLYEGLSFQMDSSHHVFLEQYLINILAFLLQKNESILITFNNTLDENRLNEVLKANYLTPLVLNNISNKNDIITQLEGAIKALNIVKQNVKFLKKHALYFKNKEQHLKSLIKKHYQILNLKIKNAPFLVYEVLEKLYALPYFNDTKIPLHKVPSYQDWKNYKRQYQEFLDFKQQANPFIFEIKSFVFQHFNYVALVSQLKKIEQLANKMEIEFRKLDASDMPLSSIIEAELEQEMQKLFKTCRLKSLLKKDSKNRFAYEKKCLKIKNINEKYNDKAKQVGLKNVFLNSDSLQKLSIELENDLKVLVTKQNLLEKYQEHFNLKPKVNFKVLQRKILSLNLYKKKCEKLEKQFEIYYSYSFSFLNPILSKYDKLNHTSFSLNKTAKNQLSSFKILMYPVLDSYENFSILQIKNWIQSIDSKQLKQAFELFKQIKKAPESIQYFVFENNVKTEEIEFSMYKKILDQFWNEHKTLFLHFDPTFPYYFMEMDTLSRQKMEANWLFIIENKFEKLKKHYNQNRIEALFTEANNLKNENGLKLLTCQKNALKPIVICNKNENQISETSKNQFDWVVDLDLKTMLSKKTNFQNHSKQIKVEGKGNDFYEIKKDLNSTASSIKSDLEAENIILQTIYIDSILFYKTSNTKKWFTILIPSEKQFSIIQNCIQNDVEVFVISPIYWFYNKEAYRQIVLDWINK
jgi:hypothetical protein